MKRHAQKPGTSTPVCGRVGGKLADKRHPVDCKMCIQLMAGNYSKTRSDKFQFSVRRQGIGLKRIMWALDKNRGEL